MTTVTRTTRESHSEAQIQSERAVIRGVITITSLAIIAVLCVALATQPQMGGVAQAAISAIGAVALASIGALRLWQRKGKRR